MKKIHHHYEQNSVAKKGKFSLKNLMPYEAKRLRKNLCQDLSSRGENSLHCRS